MTDWRTQPMAREATALGKTQPFPWYCPQPIPAQFSVALMCISRLAALKADPRHANTKIEKFWRSRILNADLFPTSSRELINCKLIKPRHRDIRFPRSLQTKTILASSISFQQKERREPTDGCIHLMGALSCPRASCGNWFYGNIIKHTGEQMLFVSIWAK